MNTNRLRNTGAHQRSSGAVPGYLAPSFPFTPRILSPKVAIEMFTRLLVIQIAFAFLVASAAAQDPPLQMQLKKVEPSERVRSEIVYSDGTVVLLSDFQERINATRYQASGRVEITFKDIVITCDRVEYDEATMQGSASGHVKFSQGQQWLSCSKAEFNYASQTGTFYDASGYTDQQFMIRGRTVRKVAPEIYTVEDGFITSCAERRPKWSFSTSSSSVHVDKTARLRGVTFRLKGIPILYAPYVVLPMFKKERSSGFTPFHTGNSTSKGRLFSQGYYQTLGPSMDLTAYADYFTLRGIAVGGIFRARPNEHTRLYAQAYGIRDKLGQGGAHLIIEGESLLKEGLRAVSRVNVTTSFDFRQAFSDTFRSATIPQEQAIVFLTRTQGSTAANLSFQREEVLYPVRSLIIRRFPSLEFQTLGTQIGKLPLILYLRTSLEGVSRVDNTLETPKIMQRLDLYPRVALRVPSFAGFSLFPSVGVRETYYSGRRSDASPTGFVSETLKRQYADFILDLRTPTLEKVFHSKFGSIKHVIEPTAVYRRIGGIKDFHEIIRFDQDDAVANTNEVEYGVINRFFRGTDNPDGTRRFYEFLSLSLKQKYYFDPSFGGAFRPGELNIFYPLDTLTGFSNTTVQRNLAPLSGVARVAPNGTISQELRLDYDTRFQRLRDLSISNNWQQGKFFLAGTYFKIQALEPGTYDQDHIQGQIAYGSAQRGLSGSLTMSYNIQSGSLLNSHSRLNYMWDCCGLSLEFQQFALGLRTETRFTFSFTLKGLGSFGNIKRPESLF
jgi:LPS-assembly protein